MSATLDDGGICVIGLGYIGAPLAILLAAAGKRVTGVERNGDICDLLLKKKIHIHEEGLPLELAIDSGRLRVEDSLPDDPDLRTYIVCVGTPLDVQGRPDLAHVEQAVAALAAVVREGDLVILRSTLPVGATRQLLNGPLREKSPGVEIAFCPERTAQGMSAKELRTLPQIVAGSSPQAVERAGRLFRTLTDQVIPVADFETAELAKLVCNSFRYTIFGFANEFARLCEYVGVSAGDVLTAASTGYARGAAIPVPGPVGGSCLPKDVVMLDDAFRSFTLAGSGLLEYVTEVNAAVPSRIADTLAVNAPRLEEPGLLRVALLGVAFKGDPATDDDRASPSNEILAALRDRFTRMEVVSHDPLVSAARQRALGYEPAATALEAVEGAHIAVIGTNHQGYARIPLADLVRLMCTPCVVYDVWAVHAGESSGLPDGATYHAFGAVPVAG
ncbi:nucleotide sugar dehydrogenase [Streptomyces canus]|jgi:UDP-N-acetyl-D-mannosaminuronic acid dehydrogenase|uniref:nucleotide sugar dehydrogenase n=1 Tax=Streptomyces canus TaxID=58343 RepID=UPI003719E7B1